MLLLSRMFPLQAPSASFSGALPAEQLCIHLFHVGKHGQCCWPQANSVAYLCRTFFFKIHCHFRSQIPDTVYWSIPRANKNTKTAVMDKTHGPSSTASHFQQGKAQLLPRKCLWGLCLQRKPAWSIWLAECVLILILEYKVVLNPDARDLSPSFFMWC